MNADLPTAKSVMAWHKKMWKLEKKSKPITVSEWLGTKTTKNKYKAKRVVVDNISFHSKGESDRYKYLSWQQKAGLISDLILQRKFNIYISDIKICSYVSDFTYMKNGKWVVEDFKGYDTPLSKFKRKCVEALYAVKIDIIRSKQHERRARRSRKHPQARSKKEA